MKMRSLAFATLISALAVPAFTADGHHPENFVVQKAIELRDGGTLFVYQDGKMAVEDKYGNPAARVKAGAVVQTKSGEAITIRSNEIQRLQRAHSERGS